LFRLHHWKPDDYFEATTSQKIVYQAFIDKEQEDISEEIESSKR
jgi:hypothetical protein